MLSVILLFLTAFFFAESILIGTIIFSFAMISLFISGYSFNTKSTFCLFIFSVVLLWILLFSESALIYSSLFIFNFSLIALFSSLFQRSFKTSLRNSKKSAKNLNERFLKLKEDDLKMLQKNKKTEIRVNEIEDLYEITKDMSIALEFEKIFEIFSNLVIERFNFKRCSLIYVEKTEKLDAGQAKVLRISKGELQRKSDFTQMDKILLNYFAKEEKAVYIKTDDSIERKRGFGLSVDINTFTAVPLIIERELMGVLSIENLQEEDFEKFYIVAGQFALEMKKAILYEQVENLALTDGLTGIFVRRYFLERLNEEIERSKRHNLSLGLIMIDIDFFKRCNDAYGHLVGDVVLKEVALSIKKCIRDVDLAGRYGGEELCIALPETDLEGVKYVAERIRESVEEKKIIAYDEIVSITISGGISLYPNNKKKVIDLIKAADEALYKAKRTGKNKICIYAG
ncbi:MAG: sensor domain-containing diguanylate cyclase [Candidatus Omnitrophota bacterium]